MRRIDLQVKISDDEMWNEIDKKFKETGGVYILKCSTSHKNFVPTTLNRLLDCDKKGILYIGKANSFLDRVPNLKKSISPHYNSSSHECGSRYKSNDEFKEKLPYDNLYLELYGSDEPIVLEKFFLKDYEELFGELPPFNRVS